MSVAATLLSLLSALCYGVGDFALGVASRQNRVLSTSFVFQILGMPVLVAILVIARMPPPSGAVLLDAVYAGGCLAVGGLTFVASLAKGKIAVIAPLTAVGAAGVPVVVGALRGERPSSVAAVGIALALVALILLTTDRSIPISRGGVPEGILAALGFGGYFVFLRDGNSGGWWTLAVSRGLVVVASTIALLALRRSPWVVRGSLRSIVVAATCSAAAASAFLFASSTGDLSLTAVLASLYPAVTVCLAVLMLHEILTPRQRYGGMLAVVAIGCIAAS